MVKTTEESRSTVRAPATTPAWPSDLKMRATGLDFYYGGRQALYSIGLQISTGRITALIGPSGCGKTTFLRILNRMYETVPRARAEGEVLLDGEDIFALDVVGLRRRVGMVFQKPNPFP